MSGKGCRVWKISEFNRKRAALKVARAVVVELRAEISVDNDMHEVVALVHDARGVAVELEQMELAIVNHPAWGCDDNDPNVESFSHWKAK